MHVIHIPFVCHLYVLVCDLYVTPIYSYVIRLSLVCSCMYSNVIRMSLVCTRMYSYVIRMSLVCHSYVLVCYPYVTRMWFYHEPIKKVKFLHDTVYLLLSFQREYIMLQVFILIVTSIEKIQIIPSKYLQNCLQLILFPCGIGL